jgi:hypothetical protein
VAKKGKVAPADPDDQWEAIAEQAVSAAEGVDCVLSEFARGLLVIERSIRQRRELADDEARHAGSE